MTHKSFAHGLKPYNENLAIIGRHFLRLQTISYASSQESENPGAINGQNFDVSLAKISTLMSATPVTSNLCQRLGIDRHIFWKSPKSNNTNNDGRSSNLVMAKTMDALVGAVLMTLGQYKAQKFVQDRLLEGPNSLISIAKEIYH